MTHAAEGMHALLPRLPRAGARLAMRLQAKLALAGLTVAPTEPAASQGLWLALTAPGADILLRPLDAASCRNAPRLLIWMEQIAPLIVALEHALGVEFAVCGTEPAPAPHLGVVRLRAGETEILAAADADSWAGAPARAFPDAAAAAGLSAATLVQLSAPRLTRAQAQRFAQGGCLLLEQAARSQVAAALTLGERAVFHGVFDPRLRAFLAQTMNPLKETSMTSSIGAAATHSGAWETHRTAIADSMIDMDIRLPRVNAKVGDLAALRPNYLLPLEIEGATLAVDIHADGRLFAHGHVVSVGDAFGIVIDQMADPAAR